jgi:hypothetical protein
VGRTNILGPCIAKGCGILPPVTKKRWEQEVQSHLFTSRPHFVHPLMVSFCNASR